MLTLCAATAAACRAGRRLGRTAVCDRRAAAARAARTDFARRLGARHDPGDRPRRAASARRPARRDGLRAGTGHLRLHPDRSHRGRPGDREDRAVGDVRSRERLRRVPRVGVAAGSPRRQRHAEGQRAAVPERRRDVRARSLLRPPQRRRLHAQRDRRPHRRPGHRRALEPRLEHGLGREGGGFRRRVDGGSRPAVQVAALPAGHRAGLGLQRAPDRPLEERILAPDAGRTAGGGQRRLSHVARGDDRRPRSAARIEEPRVQAVRDLERVSDSHGERFERRTAERFERSHGRRRHRRQVRDHPEPDRRLHRQHRLRAGRGRRAADQPHPLQPVLPRKARFLPRERRALRLRRRQQLQCGPQRPAAALLQPADRAQCRPGRADRRRRRA